MLNRKLILGTLTLLLAGGCAKTEDDKKCSEGRTIAVESSYNQGTGAVAWNCRFSTDAQVNGKVPANSYQCNSGVRFYQYNSKDEFIDEAKLVGKRSFTKIKVADTLSWEEILTTESGKLKGWTNLDGTGDYYSFSSWQDDGRPSIGYRHATCGSKNVAITYDDFNRVETISEANGGIGCSVKARTVKNYYDANKNLAKSVISSTSQASVVTTVTTEYTITKTEEVCK